MGRHRPGSRAALRKRAAREPLAALQGMDVRDPANRVVDVRHRSVSPSVAAVLSGSEARRRTYRPRRDLHLVGSVVFLVAFMAASPPRPNAAQLRLGAEAAARASPELLERLRADPFTYFRFINRVWTERVCQMFADVHPPMVRLHGDAHVEQFALTKDAWGLDDFDDSARGPAFIDIVRFLGSIDLATRERGWTRARDSLWDRFLEGYRTGLSNPDYRPPEPAIVHRLRQQAPMARAAFLLAGERRMRAMDDSRLKSVSAAMEALDRVV